MNTAALEVRFRRIELLAINALAPGYSFRVNYGAKNPNNRVGHVRAGPVDGDVFVVRYWNKYHQRWYYKCEDAYALGYLIEQGVLFVIGRDPEWREINDRS